MNDDRSSPRNWANILPSRMRKKKSGNWHAPPDLNFFQNHVTQHETKWAYIHKIPSISSPLFPSSKGTYISLPDREGRCRRSASSAHPGQIGSSINQPCKIARSFFSFLQVSAKDHRTKCTLYMYKMNETAAAAEPALIPCRTSAA